MNMAATVARPSGRLTVARFFALLLGLLIVAAAGALLLAIQAGRVAVVRAGEIARQARANEVAAAIERDFAAAPAAVHDVETALETSLVAPDDHEAVSRLLAVVLLAHPNLIEVTLTRAVLQGYAPSGEALLAPQGRLQLSAFRDEQGLVHRRLSRPNTPDGPDDPTRHDTFQAAAHRDARGELLWSDLAYTELDRAIPEGQRRKTLTAQKALFTTASITAGSRASTFVGVLRTGLTSDTLEQLGRPTSSSGAAQDPHIVFITDTHGRLVTRLAPDQRYVTMNAEGRDDEEGDLRVRVERPADAVAAALTWARQQGAGTTRMTLAGEPWLLTLQSIGQAIEGTQPQPWLVAVVVPERVYVGALLATRNRLFLLFGLLAAGLAAAAWAGTRSVGRAMGALVQSTEAMQRFAFMPRPIGRTRFHEITAALESLERAKTALRALVKYVPIDLVRQLYERGQEPTLGAELTCVTLMFTDIADFTTHAESLPPDRLAQALGRYFETATSAVESHRGTVDKYIGDALMVLWNAPRPLPGHAREACKAALACAKATRALARSPWWTAQGLPAWHTRIGLHTGDVLVGHFGAPDRLNYTAMGDGVNLAARLEGLNKIYGTTILVSEDVRTQADEGFLFRLVDRVAVKGKHQAVAIHELMADLTVDLTPDLTADLTTAGTAQVAAMRTTAARYEGAWAAALRRDFGAALQALASLPDDGPAQVLAARCQKWLLDPPPADWDGTWIAPTK